MQLFKLTVIFVILKISTAKIEPFIVNGRDAGIEKWPFIAFILYSFPNGSMACTCGGSLLSTQTVLTAAHCLDDVTDYKAKLPTIANPDDKGYFKKIEIMMGHTEWRKATMIREVIDYETHAKYDTESTDYDIGVMFLLNPVEFSHTVKKTVLQKRPLIYPRQKNLLVAGWGIWLDRETGTLGVAEHLQYLPHVLIPKSECEKSDNLTLIYGQICAGSSADEKFVYSGDSGGPLITADGFQVGLVSFKLEQNSKGVTVFTHIPDYYHWIKETELKLYRKYCPDQIQAMNENRIKLILSKNHT